ncbi:MAG: T9SS type A sorting domain-containing protein [Melioribacteraceae bacterium]|nr:T9SS type A sorting domain-containing protein [Melioribacteraceae bacterium]
MNFNFSFFDFTSTNGQKSFRIGDDYSAHTVMDSIGFTTYNWRRSRHGYGGFASNLSGYIFNGKIYGEILTNYIVGVEQDIELPTKYSLSQNYPNPFNPTTTIKYSIPIVETRYGASPIVLLKIYDVLGREIATLVNEEKAPGNYEVVFNGANLPSGIYFYKMSCGNFSETKKLVLMK